MPASPLPNLPSLLRAIGQAQTKVQRALAFDDLVAVLQASDTATPFIRKMIRAGRDGRRIAFEVLIRLPQPISFEVIELVGPFLGRRLPSKLRLQAAKILLESLPADHEFCSKLLDFLTRKLDEDEAASRLKSLQKISNRSEIVQAIIKRKQISERLCPRCGLRFQVEEFAQHLWATHRLLYVGQRVREPWEIIHSWLSLYQKTNQPSLLEKAALLARQLDPDQGQTRLKRMILAQDSSDPFLQNKLRQEALQAKAGLCPMCLALVPLPYPTLKRPYVFAADGTIEWNGWKIEVNDSGLLAHLKIQEPGKAPVVQLEPKRPVTRLGVVWLYCFPLLLLSLFGSLLTEPKIVPPVLVSTPLILLALVGYYLMRNLWDGVSSRSDRAADYAWQFLEPKEQSQPFLMGLLWVSRQYGDPKVREKPLRRLLDQLRNSNPSSIPVQLAIEIEYRDAISLGWDELLPLSRLAEDCFEGQIPLYELENTLLEIRPSLTKGSRSRLRVLLLHQAFRAGLMPLDLRDIGRACPTLGASLASEDIKGLSRLYIVYQMRNTRPWGQVGSAATAFDLARYPALGREFLSEHPNLLLVQFGSDLADEESEPSPLLICEDGIVYNRQTIGRDSVIRFRQKSILRGGGYELYLDKLVWQFRSSPHRLKERLEFWRDFLFRTIRPQARDLEGRSGKRDLLLNRHLSSCPECRTSFVVVLGEMGIRQFSDDEES